VSIYVYERKSKRDMLIIYTGINCSSELAYSSPPCICCDGSHNLRVECMEQKSEESMCAKLPQCSSQRCEMVSARALSTFLWIWLHITVGRCGKGNGDSGFQRRSNCCSYKIPSRQFKYLPFWRFKGPYQIMGCQNWKSSA